MLAGKHWLNAAAEARQLQKMRKAADSKGDSSSTDSTSLDIAAGAVGGVRADRQQVSWLIAGRVNPVAVVIFSHMLQGVVTTKEAACLVLMPPAVS